MSDLLSHIDSPDDLKQLHYSDLIQLAQDIRHYIIDVVSVKKGHLGAGLGVVELTIALHYVYNTPDDVLIWDVGHQAYPHKILTGRREAFNTLRQKNGISGFPKRSESDFDAFGTGHSSTSISALLGIAMASRLEGREDRKHIAVIGDASIAAGMAFEALNHAGDTDADVLIVLNDNQMGIDPHVGALKNYLTQIKTTDNGSGQNLFEALNFQYFGPVDGHNIQALIRTFNQLKKISGPKVLHVITTKGKGLTQAEKDQITYHAPGLFDKNTGELIKAIDENLPPKYQDVFGLTLVELARANKKIIGITAAMPTGTSLKYMIEALPERAYDVGIAEQHALTFAAGFATRGFRPYVAVYSTFLQRAYDQLIHDIALQKLPVVLCIDRAGIVGEDGATHHGVFDIAFLRIIPHLIVAVPSDELMLRQLLYTAQFVNQPMAIRYPRGRGLNTHWQKPYEKMSIGKGRLLTAGHNIAVLSIGPLANTIQNIINQHPEWSVAHYDMIFVKPLDKALLDEIFETFDHIVTVEDGVKSGGFGSAVLEYALAGGYDKTGIDIFGIPDQFMDHGTTAEIKAEAGLDEANLERFLASLIAEKQ
ncbi:MAG: 1-deoxy-D-xylulose-5-phosphate synthase [Flavobacteriia bacterium]|nr:MAG: 1-deoxy-D-xylulose-5-phosphate synthase [Flavobacteriia bacterium]